MRVKVVGFRVSDLGFRIQDLGFGGWSLGSRFRVGSEVGVFG